MRCSDFTIKSLSWVTENASYDIIGKNKSFHKVTSFTLMEEKKQKGEVWKSFHFKMHLSSSGLCDYSSSVLGEAASFPLRPQLNTHGRKVSTIYSFCND